MIYRDATYSAKTQASLRDLQSWLQEAKLSQWAKALGDVLDRWEANKATEVRDAA